MSEEQKVSQPQNDVQEAEVKETKTDEIKEEPKFTQADMDRVVQQRLAADRAKQQSGGGPKQPLKQLHCKQHSQWRRL